MTSAPERLVLHSFATSCAPIDACHKMTSGFVSVFCSRLDMHDKETQSYFKQKLFRYV